MGRLLFEAQSWQDRGTFLLDGIKAAGVQSQGLKDGGGDLVVSTKVVTVRAWKLGFDTNSMTLVFSCAKPQYFDDDTTKVIDRLLAAESSCGYGARD
jgi:hypothetical protein